MKMTLRVRNAGNDEAPLQGGGLNPVGPFEVKTTKSVVSKQVSRVSRLSVPGKHRGSAYYDDQRMFGDATFSIVLLNEYPTIHVFKLRLVLGFALLHSTLYLVHVALK